MNILIVEDDVNIQNLLKNCIAEVNNQFVIHISENAKDAFIIAKEHDIQLFLLDIQLTDYKGTELAKQLRMLEEYRFTPMIFATAIATEELQAYRELKCYSYLLKPFTKEEVKHAIKEVIDYIHSFRVEKKTVRIEQNGFIFEYKLEDIVYIESFGKRLELHMKIHPKNMVAESIRGYSLKGMLEHLNETSFIQSHKSYLVNTDYIERIDKTNNLLKLRNLQQELPIGQKYRDQLLGVKS